MLNLSFGWGKVGTRRETPYENTTLDARGDADHPVNR